MGSHMQIQVWFIIIILGMCLPLPLLKESRKLDQYHETISMSDDTEIRGEDREGEDESHIFRSPVNQKKGKPDHRNPPRFNPRHDILSEYQIDAYLERFGYLIRRTDTVSLDKHVEAIKRFQNFNNLAMTGNFDDATRALMNTPRCGAKDLDHHSRTKRYEPPWNHTHITYRLSNFSQSLGRTKTRRIIRKAFKIWEDNTALTFTKVSKSEKANIEVEFVTGRHGCALYNDQCLEADFDGAGGVLAHSMLPDNYEQTTFLHLDNDEHFVTGDVEGICLLRVAVHEVGHTIGLGHSSHPNSVMNPFLEMEETEEGFQLSDDDIQGVDYLYGPQDSTNSE